MPLAEEFHVLLLRHGQTDSNAGGVIQGWLPVPLNEAGREQSRRLAARLATFVPRIRRLISSDLIRARQTAEPIAATLGIEPVFDARWRERGLGELEGQTIGETDTWRAATGEISAPGAESVETFRNRAADAFESLPVEHRDGSPVAVVTHGGTIRSILWLFATGRLSLAAAAGTIAVESPEVQMIANCSILHLVGERSAGDLKAIAWRIVSVNDVAHLDDGTVTARDRG